VNGRATAAALTVAVAIALGLRLWALADDPPAFFEDELSGAVSAWRIATTGSDVGPTHLPFLTTRLELKQPVYFALTLPTQALLGTTALATRLPAAFLGAAGVLLIWWVARALELGRGTALVAAALFGVLPWAVHYGRVGWEPAAMLPFTLAGVALLCEGLRLRRPRRIVAAAAVLALGAYAYHPALAANAVLAVVVVAIRWRHAVRRQAVIALAVAGAVAVAILVPYVATWASEPLFTARAHLLWVFEKGVDRAAIDRAFDGYMAHWDWRELVRDAGPDLRTSPGRAPLYAFVLPFLAVGAFALLRDRRPSYRVLIAWLLLAPLSGALMQEPGPVSIEWSRSLAFLAAVTLTTAFGLATALEAARRWRPRLRITAAAVLVIVASIEVSGFVGDYFGEYPRRSAAAWHDGAGRALAAARETVPDGGLLCVDSRWYFTYTFPQQAALYLEPRRFSVIEGWWTGWDERCGQPGAHILTVAGLSFPMPVTAVRTTYDITGAPRFVEVVVAEAAR